MIASLLLQPTHSLQTPGASQHKTSLDKVAFGSGREAQKAPKQPDSLQLGSNRDKKNSSSSALEHKDNWRDGLSKWRERKSLQIIRAFENSTLWIKKNISKAMMVFSAIVTVVPMPVVMREFIERKFFFAPPKTSSIHLLNSDELKQNILELNFHPKGVKTPSLNAWYLEAQNGKPTIVFSHGRHCNISQHETLLQAFHRKGYGVFIYDYPGFGRSEGKPSEKALYQAGLSASKFLAKDGVAGLGVPYKQQILMGHSLGGGVAVDVAEKLSRSEATKPKALVVINSFTTLKEAFKEQKQAFSWAIKKMFDENKSQLNFNSRQKIRHVGVPVMVTHGMQDKVIHSKLGEELIGAFKRAQPETGGLYGKFYPMHQTGHYLNDKACSELVSNLELFLKDIGKKSIFRL